MKLAPSALLATALLTALPAAAGPVADRVRATATVRVCIWPDYYGITFRNPKSGELSGIDEVMSSHLARDLGVRVVHVDSSFPAFADDLLADRCDVAMFGVGITPERAARVRFTQPYLRSDIWAVTTKTHPSIRSWDDIDRPGRVVAVQAGTFMEPVMKATLKHAELMSVKLPDTRERELQAGLGLSQVEGGRAGRPHEVVARRVEPHAAPVGGRDDPAVTPHHRDLSEQELLARQRLEQRV